MSCCLLVFCLFLFSFLILVRLSLFSVTHGRQEKPSQTGRVLPQLEPCRAEEYIYPSIHDSRGQITADREAAMERREQMGRRQRERETDHIPDRAAGEADGSLGGARVEADDSLELWWLSGG